MQKKIVLTLDAGGTNFVFSAIHQQDELIAPVVLPSNAHNLDECLKTIEKGFSLVLQQLKESPLAISFAFPGPADYPAGIIGDLGNLPAFRGGVALGPWLNRKFNLPVFINNDGDLFALGEAMAGWLPFVNQKLENQGVSKQYKNLLGITLGTGFGAGIVIDGRMLTGDNSAAAEIWCSGNPFYQGIFIEESVSARAVVREYQNVAGMQYEELTPELIYQIAKGEIPGNQIAAQESWKLFGHALGEALANAITLIDGLIVIGGGLSKAASLFMPHVIRQMNGTLLSLNGNHIPRLELKAYYLDEPEQWEAFANGGQKEIYIPETQEKICWQPEKKIGIGISKLGTSKAVAIGAWAYAMAQLNIH